MLAGVDARASAVSAACYIYRYARFWETKEPPAKNQKWYVYHFLWYIPLFWEQEA